MIKLGHMPLIALVLAGCASSPGYVANSGVTTSPTPSVSASSTSSPGTAPAPNLSFLDRNQAEDEINSLLADDKAHTVGILFKDEYRIRVASGKGLTRDVHGMGFHALDDADDVIPSLERVLGQYRFKAIYPSSMAQGKTEAELDAMELERSRLVNADVPHAGSWAYLELEAYSDEAVKELTLQLQRVHGVRHTHVLP